MKKAQGLSVNVIIIAAIALLVLVVLSVIYIGRMGDWGAKAADCENKGGNCVTGSTCPSSHPTKFEAWNCPTNQICCINVTG